MTVSKKDTVNRYQCAYQRAYLSTDFGLQLACKKFSLTPEQLEEKVGRYSRGKRKGQLKGVITWAKVTRGGWVKTGPYDFDAMRADGFVVRPGVCFGFAIQDSWNDSIILLSKTAVFDGHYLDTKASLIRHLTQKETTTTNTVKESEKIKEKALQEFSDKMSAYQHIIEHLQKNPSNDSEHWIGVCRREIDTLFYASEKIRKGQ